MHSKIFQITETRVSKDNYLNEDTLTQGDDSFFDYCAEIDDEERQFHIDNLVNNILPKGMFELVSDDTIRYKGGAERWREDFIADIRSRAEALTPESVQDWIGPVLSTRKVPEKPARYRLLVLHGRGGAAIQRRAILRVPAAGM